MSHFIFQSWVFQILLSCDVLKCWLINHFSVQKRRSNSIIFFCIKRREENWICHNPYTKLFVGRIENHFMLEWYLKYLNEKLFINCRRFSVFLSYLSEIMRGFPIYSLVYKHWEFNSEFSPENIIVALITVFNISFLVNGFMIHTSYDKRYTSALFF